MSSMSIDQNFICVQISNLAANCSPAIWPLLFKATPKQRCIALGSVLRISSPEDDIDAKQAFADQIIHTRWIGETELLTCLQLSAWQGSRNTAPHVTLPQKIKIIPWVHRQLDTIDPRSVQIFLDSGCSTRYAGSCPALKDLVAERAKPKIYLLPRPVTGTASTPSC